MIRANRSLARQMQRILRGRKMQLGRTIMLHWALVFLIATILAAILGFSSAVAAGKMLFLVFLVLFLFTLIMGSFLQRPTRYS